jgi:hypothetical protein
MKMVSSTEIVIDVIMAGSGACIVYGITQKNYIAPLVAVGLLFIRYALVPLFTKKQSFMPGGMKR